MPPPTMNFSTLIAISAAVIAATRSDILEYYVLEELAPYRVVGDLRNDFNFDERFDRNGLNSLRFAVLTQPSSDRRYFTVNETSGIIQTTHRIDREKICPGADECLIKFDVAVRSNQYFQIIKVMVVIVDENDNAPIFPDSHQAQLVSESAQVGSGFAIATATDPDSRRNGVKRYELVPPDGKFRLNIQRSPPPGDFDVRLVLIDKLDRETQESYKMTIFAIDGGEPSRTGSTFVEVTVLDANDNSPVFDRDSYEVRVPETAPVGTVLVTVRATDKDSGLNGAVHYEFSRHSAHDYGMLFAIRPDSGKIVLQQNLDFEVCSMHILSVTATDRGPDSLPAHVTVVIRVDDVNDNAPRILVNALHPGKTNPGSDVDRHKNHRLSGSLDREGSIVATIDENSLSGTFVAHVLVSDTDGTSENNRFRCAIDDNINFRLQEMYSPTSPTLSGLTAITNTASAAEFKLLTGNLTFDRERRDSYRIRVMCRDYVSGISDGWGANGGSPSLTSSVVIRVVVGDVNDNAPVFNDVTTPLVVRVSENVPTGKELIKLHATDADIGNNGQIKYHLRQSNTDESVKKTISIDESTGSITSLVPLDREMKPSFEFDVVAIDGGRPRQSAILRVNIVVLDEDDQLPKFTEQLYRFSTIENQPAGTEIGRVTAVDRDEPPFDRFVYEVDPLVTDLFAIDPRTGRLTTKTSLDREQQELHQFFVWARSDNRAEHAVGSAAVVVKVDDENDNAPRFVSQFNETLSVSSFTPPGHAITRLVAVDSDSPANAQFTYVIASPPFESPFFVVDPKTGDVRVSDAGLANIDYEVVRLTFEVWESTADKFSAADATEVSFIISRAIPFIDEVVDARESSPYFKGLSEKFNLRFDDEAMVIVLAVTLAIILVAITVVVVIFACIRSTDRRRTCVASSSTTILSSAQHKNLSSSSPIKGISGLKSAADAPHNNGNDWRQENGHGSNRCASLLFLNGNSNSKRSDSKKAIGHATVVSAIENGYKFTPHTKTIGTGKQSCNREEISTAQSAQVSPKPVIVFIKDTNVTSYSDLRNVDGQARNIRINVTTPNDVTVNHSKTAMSPPVSPGNGFRQSMQRTSSFQPRRVSRDPLSQSYDCAKFSGDKTFPRGHRVADVEPSPLREIRHQEHVAGGALSLSYSDLQSGGDFNIVEPTIRAVGHVGANNAHYSTLPHSDRFVGEQHYRATCDSRVMEITDTPLTIPKLFHYEMFRQ